MDLKYASYKTIIPGNPSLTDITDSLIFFLFGLNQISDIPC